MIRSIWSSLSRTVRIFVCFPILQHQILFPHGTIHLQSLFASYTGTLYEHRYSHVAARKQVPTSHGFSWIPHDQENLTLELLSDERGLLRRCDVKTGHYSKPCMTITDEEYEQTENLQYR